MFGTITLIVVVLIVALLVYASTRPDSFRVERSLRMKAPPEKVYGLIEDFHQWAGWSPWEKLDPAMKKTFSGAPAGKGAVYEWEGNNQVGQGRMEILEAARPSAIDIKLDFLRPFEAHNSARFALAPSGDSTEVTWSMAGASPFFMKVMGLFFSMDKMVGKDFEKGLAEMKRLAEG